MPNEGTGQGVVRWGGVGTRGKLLITAWDFIKPRLSCAQCIVYYLALLRGFGAGNTLVSSFPTSPSPLPLLDITYQDVDLGRENNLAGLLCEN